MEVQRTKNASYKHKVQPVSSGPSPGQRDQALVASRSVSKDSTSRKSQRNKSGRPHEDPTVPTTCHHYQYSFL